jgi:energy coupling factor transporter S component ThiW
MASALESKKIALASTLTALGIVIAPFIWFPFMGSRAYPGQHLINALAGGLVGCLDSYNGWYNKD